MNEWMNYEASKSVFMVGEALRLYLLNMAYTEQNIHLQKIENHGSGLKV